MKTTWTSRILTWFLVLLPLCSQILGLAYKSIVWSPENPIFVENKLKCVLPKSRLNIICPSLHFIVADTKRVPIKDNLYENVWLVDKAAYDSCNITKQNNDNKKLLVCNKPLFTKYHTIVFQEMSPNVEELEFEPGKDYFLIATSDGTLKSLGNAEGGHCRARSMKLRIHMCIDSKDPHCLSEEKCQQLLKTTMIQSVPGSKPREPKIICNHTTAEPNANVSSSPPNVPNNSLPPNSQYMDTSRLVYYHLGISLLVLMCASLLALSAYLGYRLQRKNKQQSPCIKNRNFEARRSRVSDGAESAEGEDSNMLISRMNSNKV